MCWCRHWQLYLKGMNCGSDGKARQQEEELGPRWPHDAVILIDDDVMMVHVKEKGKGQAGLDEIYSWLALIGNHDL